MRSQGGFLEKRDSYPKIKSLYKKVIIKYLLKYIMKISGYAGILYKTWTSVKLKIDSDFV